MSPEKTKGPAKDRVLQAMYTILDAKQWEPLLQMLDINDEETSERMTRLLILHLLLDRAVTVVLTTRVLDRSKPAFSEIEALLAVLEMEMRIDLAKAAHLISPSCASDIKTVNTVRNKLVHYQPKRGWGMGHVQELSSVEAYERCIDKGRRALQEVVDTIRKNIKEISQTR